MARACVFDAQNYERLNAARGAVVKEILRELGSKLELETAIDVGCGTGFFADLLSKEGLQVVGVDGRRENVEEAQRRYPGNRFLCCDAEDAALGGLGTFDVVFCFGLIYHLENPLLVVRQLRRMTGELLLVEGVTYPGDEPTMTLVDEASSEDQGLRHVAFYPTEACLVKMLYRGGFAHVYRATRMPEHPEYHEAPGWRRNRTVLAAARSELRTGLLVRVEDPAQRISPWDPASGAPGRPALNKLRRFLHRPLAVKLQSVKRFMLG